ncbi:MAG TPA: hypothetical protein VHY22_12750 [Chthoniobacteraceae bacterium]|nr:hypothetical protein [Chthoniobacteraceae bacterium]
MPAIFGDHMILQAGKKVAIWGTAAPGASVSVQWLDESEKIQAQDEAIADGTGHWLVRLPPPTEGIHGRVRVAAAGEIRIFQDVAVGETWLCGGQSNMEYPLGSALNAKKNIAQAGDPEMRLFLVPHQCALTPHDDLMGKWVVCAPDTVRGFSAVGYYFGRDLRVALHVPVGLIGSYWGGTMAQSWMSLPALEKEPALASHVTEYRRAEAACPGGDADFQAKSDAYNKAVEQWSKAIADDPNYQAARMAWKQADEQAKAAHQPEPPQPRPPVPHPTATISEGGVFVPTLMYNGMIAPLVPFTLRGVIWFQADGNLAKPREYGLLIKTLINDWRHQWNDVLPFYYVEMNNMRDYPQKSPVQYNDLSILREQQAAALELPHTGVACSIDLGLPEPNPHFPNKKPVGDRLANLALSDIYQHPGPVQSPHYHSFQVEQNKVRLHFDDAAGLRIRNGGAIQGFAIRGTTGDWVWARGRIEGSDIVVWSDAVPNPAAVRYAWAMNPVTSIENGAGLPLRPFRTDTDIDK